MTCCPQASKTTAPSCKDKRWLRQLAVVMWILAVAAMAAVVGVVVVGKVRLLPVSMSAIWHAASYPAGIILLDCKIYSIQYTILY